MTNYRITDLDQVASPQDEDLIELSHDVTTTPISKSISLQQLRDDYLAATFSTDGLLHVSDPAEDPTFNNLYLNGSLTVHANEDPFTDDFPVAFWGTEPSSGEQIAFDWYGTSNTLSLHATFDSRPIHFSTTGNIAASGQFSGDGSGLTGVTAASIGFTVSATQGGTGLTSYVQGDLLYASASNTLSKLAKNTTAQRVLTNAGASNNPSWGQVDLTTGVTGTLPQGNGGTGFSTYTTGDLLYASAANTLSKLTFGSSNTILRTASGTTPSWGKLDLANDINGILNVSNGGLGTNSGVQGDIPFYSASTTISKLAKDTNASRYLSNQGTSNNPSWSQINLANGVSGDLPFANLTQLSARSVLGVTGNSTADVAGIQGTANQVLRINAAGDTLFFGQVNLSSSAAITGTLPIANGGTNSASYSATNGAIYYNGTSFVNSNSLLIGTSEIVVNESGANLDFRAEGDTDVNNLVLDASADSVGIGTSSPDTKLELQTNSTWGKQALTIDQDDTDQAFIDFQGSVTADAPDGEIASITTFDPYDGNWSDAGHLLMEVNGNSNSYIMYRSYCVTGDTMIMTPTGSMAIAALQVGDIVIGWDNKRKIPVEGRIQQVEIHANTDHYYLINNELKITGNHKVIVNGEWREVHRINVGDHMLGPDGSIEIESIAYVGDQDITTYNIKLDNIDKNYFANGYCIHNAKCPRIDAWIDGKWIEIGRAIMYLDGKDKEGQWDIELPQALQKFRMVEDEPEISRIQWIKGDGEEWSLGEVITKPASFFGATDGSIHEFEFSKPVIKLETFGYYEIVKGN